MGLFGGRPMNEPLPGGLVVGEVILEGAQPRLAFIWPEVILNPVSQGATAPERLGWLPSSGRHVHRAFRALEL